MTSRTSGAGFILLAALLCIASAAPASDVPARGEDRAGPPGVEGWGSRLETEALATSPLTLAAPRAVGPLVLGSDVVNDSTLVASVDLGRYTEILAILSGHQPFELAGQIKQIRTRWTLEPDAPDGIALARDYLQDRFMAAGYPVQLQSFDVSNHAGITATNVIAVKTGLSRPDEILVVGAHYDATAIRDAGNDAPGAEDNASGTAGVLHLAELLEAWETERTIHFVAFGAEEQGLHGSTWYAQKAIDDGLQIVGALTMDMISAWVDDYGILIEGTNAYEELMFAVRDNVVEWTTLDFDLSYFSFDSDHVPFQERGIPAILGIDLDWAAHTDNHKSTDTFDKVDPSLGTEITRAMAGTVADIAGLRDVIVPVAASTTGRLKGRW